MALVQECLCGICAQTSRKFELGPEREVALVAVKKRVEKKVNYKKQHPTDPNLFWCQMCQGYRDRNDFHSHRSGSHQVTQYCREHSNEMDRRRHPKYTKKSPQGHFSRKHPEIEGLFWCSRCEKFKDKNSFGFKACNVHQIYEVCISCRTDPVYKQQLRIIQSASRKRSIEMVSDCYIRENIRKRGFLEITPETISLVRQRIIMKRTLKEFKKWREENESNCTDVDGKQHHNEKVIEGN